MSLANTILRLRQVLPVSLRKLAVVSLAGGILAFALSRIIPAPYAVDATLLLDAEGGMGGLGSLAQMIDVFQPGMLPTSMDASRGYTYIGVMTSRPALESILGTADPRPGAKGSLLEFFAPRMASTRRRTEIAVKELRDCIHTKFSTKDYFLEFSVITKNPAVSRRVAELLISQLEDFNTSSRVTRAHHALVFLEKRLREAADSLLNVESALITFRQSNVRLGPAPALRASEGRLERRVRLCEESYLLLSKQLEVVRLEEKRDSQVFNVINPPIEPTRPRRLPGLLVFTIGAIVSGLTLSLIHAVKEGWNLEGTRSRATK